MSKRRRAPGEGSLYQRPDGTWEAIVTIPGPPGATQRRRSRRARTKTEAARKLEKLKAEIRDGYHTPATLTLEEHLRDWVDAHKGTWKPATLSLYQLTIKNHLKTRIGGLRMRDLSSHAVQRALHATERAAGASTAAIARTILNSACEWGVRTNTLPRNPVTPVRTTPPRAKDKVQWTPEEARRFLDYTRDHPLLSLFYTLLTTGLRRGEALGLQWGDIEGNRLTVRRTVGRVGKTLTIGEPKTKRARRTIVLPPDTLAVLDQHRNRTEEALAGVGSVLTSTTPIFCDGLGAVRRPSSVLREFKRLCAAAGVPVCTLHELRHWHGSSLAAAGQDPVAVAEKLGHARASFSLNVYAHAFDRQRERAALTLSELSGEGE